MDYISFEEVKEILKKSIDETTNINEALKKTAQFLFSKGYEDGSRRTTTEKKESAVDNFFEQLYISDEHLDALKEEYDYKITLSEVGLMEECSELIQALSKRIRATDPKKDNIIEEMAHVITCIRLVCLQLKIKPEEIQQEIYKKYPDGYDTTILFANNEPYCYVERVEKSE